MKYDVKRKNEWRFESSDFSVFEMQKSPSGFMRQLILAVRNCISRYIYANIIFKAEVAALIAIAGSELNRFSQIALLGEFINKFGFVV